MATAAAVKQNSTRSKGARTPSPVIDSTKLSRTKVWGETDSAVRWQGAFALYGGEGGTTASSTIVYEIERGGRLGWHTDATEETQYIIAGKGKLYLEDGSTHEVGPGSVFAPRSREYREGDPACRRLLCRGDVHARLRPDHAAA